MTVMIDRDAPHSPDPNPDVTHKARDGADRHATGASSGAAHVREAALAAHAAGLCVVPPTEDGAKRPMGEWKRYQSLRPEQAELERWYGPSTGLGLVCGGVSGGLELLEFEGRAVAEGAFDRFVELADATGLGDIVTRITSGYSERTPGGGVHLLYRVVTPKGNTQLACRPTALDVNGRAAVQTEREVLIETRGEGGYVIVAPSGGRVHPSGGAWSLEQGGFATIASLTDAERDAIWDLARSFDRVPVRPVEPKRAARGTERPGDRYNALPDPEERMEALLTKHGWSVVWRRDRIGYLRRPGKDRGVSATLGHHPGLFYVFSSSTAFEPGRAYDAFGVFVTLEHGGDFDAAARSLGGSGTREPSGVGPAASEPIGHLSRQSLAARRFVDAVGENVRFDHGRGAWYVWDGCRWRMDRDGEVRRLWLRVLGDRYRDALGIEDGDQRARAIDAVQSAGRTDSSITSGLRIAASMKPVAFSGDGWDADPWLLGCSNGVVDLRTGSLRASDPSDLMTRSTMIAYDPTAGCPRWDQFLHEVFADDEELVAWVQKLIGASLVGVSKEFLPIHLGSGNNGKSVFARTLRRVAGDYGVEVAIETLMNARRVAGAPTSDLMRLRGARLAFTSEPEEGARLNAATLKRLATIDQMGGRELHGTQQSWDPTHTLHVSTNNLPTIDDTTDGCWRRLAIIRWPVRFAKAGQPGQPEDPGLADVLASEAPGILAWAVRGAIPYADDRTLHPLPASTARETEAYRGDQDPLREFLDRWLAPSEDGASITTAALHAAYIDWAALVPLPAAERMDVRGFGRMFKRRHRDLGYPVTPVTLHGLTAYRGVRVRDRSELGG